VANATDLDANLDADALYIKRPMWMAVPRLKRWRARAMGRAYGIRKRTSHITVVVEERR
jgi:large subunit ribosomal protein L22